MSAQTFYIDCNKSLSNDKDNLDNSQFTTQLKESITLPIGTQISIQSSFINQQGITGSSIEIDEDISETFNFMYYKMDTQDILPKDDAQFNTPVYTQYNISEGQTGGDTRERILDMSAGKAPSAGIAIPKIKDLSFLGASEQPLILLDFDNNASTCLADIRVGKKTIEIKKGVYGISELADLVTQQLNDNIDKNYNEFNSVNQRINEGSFEDSDLSYSGNKQTFAKVTVPTTSYLPGNRPNCFKPVHEDYIFCDVATANTIREARRDLNDDTGILWADPAGTTGAGLNALTNLYVHLADPDSAIAVVNYNPIRFGVYVGTPYMSLDYNNDKSSYELSGLHTPYSFPSHDFQFNPQALAGKQGVFYRKMGYDASEGIVDGITDGDAKNDLKSCFNKPLSRMGGIIIHNFAEQIAIKYSTKKGLNITDPKVTDKLKFKEFFEEEKDAKEAWKKTLWNKLGFTYEQLNDENSFEKVRYYNNSDTHTLPGMTTDTLLDASTIQTISSKISAAHFAEVNPDTSTGENGHIGLQSGTLQTYGLADTNLIGAPHGILTAGYYVNSIYSGSLMIPIEATGRSISARNLPQLSSVGYYMITSDILDGYNDIVKDGSPIALLGVVAKSSLSNQDFIYSSQDIVNTITNEKIINKIKIKFLNPDLTAPSLEANSSVILRIDIPAPPPPPPLNPLQPEDKDKEKDKKNKK